MVTNKSHVSITDDERTVWEGTFADFAVENSGALDTGEWRILLKTGELYVGGGAAPLLRITVEI